MKKMLKKLTLVGMMFVALVTFTSIAGAKNDKDKGNPNDVQSVPEPVTLMLLGAGLAGVAGLAAAQRRRKV
jgi:hypothetical protein